MSLSAERLISVRPGLGYGLVTGVLNNRTAGPLRIQVRLQSSGINWAGAGFSGTEPQTFVLEPGERTPFEFLQFCHRSLDSGTQITFSVQGRQSSSHLPAGGAIGDAWNVGLATPFAPAPGNLSRATAEWTPDHPGGWRGIAGAWPRADLDAELFESWRYRSHHGTGGRNPKSTLPGSIAWTDTERLPKSLLPLTARQAWMLDRSTAPPSDEALRALAQFVRLGGTVILAQGDASDLRFDLPGAVAAREERFVLRRFKHSKGPAVVRRFGLGYLIDSEAPPLEGTAQRNATLWAIEHLPSFVHPDEETGAQLKVPRMERGKVNHKLASILLLACGILLGPVALTMARRERNPGRLLWVVPGFSLVLTLLVAGYGLFRDGVGLHELSRSIVCLDQMAGRVAVAETRLLYSAAFGPRKLLPEAGTIVLPQLPQESRYAQQKEYFVRSHAGGGLELSGGFLPARQQCSHTVLSEQPTRQGLTVLAAGSSGVRVRSDFEATLSGLILADAEGRTFVAIGELPPGGEVDLIPGTPVQAQSALESALPYKDHPLGGTLAPATYTARLAENPFRDSLGLAPRTWGHEQAVLGVLPSDAFSSAGGGR